MVTPPGTPEKQPCATTVDRQQSITVYALFADVEQEIGRFVYFSFGAFNLEN